jgi:hypothetical protein
LDEREDQLFSEDVKGAKDDIVVLNDKVRSEVRCEFVDSLKG